MTEREKQNLIIPTNQNLKTGGYGIRPYETTEILLTLLSFRQKKNGPKKETPTADGLCHRQILGAPPPAWADHVRTPPIGRKKTFSKKGFCGAFSLKKRPSAPQRPRPQAPPRATARPLTDRRRTLIRQFLAFCVGIFVKKSRFV